MTQRSFTEPVDTYTIIRLELSDYRPPTRELPKGFTLAGCETRSFIRAQEKQVLQRTFEDWDIPYFAKLRGWREDSPMYVMCDGMLVGGLYLCAANEFDDDKQWGQLHYFFVRPEFRGKGLHSVLVKQAILRAKAWGLEGVYINTDRRGLPEVYVRWGARLWKQVPKSTRLPYNRFWNGLRTFRRRLRLVLGKSA
jgi:GNAT superfamily N-acetyltransferase